MIAPTTAPVTAPRPRPPEPGVTLIAAEGVSLAYDGHFVLDDAAIAVRRGEIVTLIGPNGSGKSSLVRVLLGLVRPQHGRVTRAPGLTIGYAPQVIARDRTLPISVARFLTLDRPRPREVIEHALEEVGAARVIDSPLAAISGGELARVSLARALLREPGLLVLDEPATGVDVAGQAALYDLIRAIRNRRGCGVLLVSHDLHVVMAATDTVVCLNRHVCCTGDARSVVQNPAFVKLFGAEVAGSLAVYHHHHDHAHAPDGHPVPPEHASGHAPEHVHG